MLNAAARIKGEKDWQKYETARKLKECVHKIRDEYRNDWKAKEMRIRQRAVAMYFIDKLALRAGHEKDEGESADCLLYTSPSPRDATLSRMPSSA